MEKNYLVITLLGCLTILAFKISKNLNFGFLKMLSKILLALHTVLHLKSDYTTGQNDQFEKIKKTHFGGQIWG